MNPEVKAEWLDALRSGNYKQGKGYLKDNKDEFCCLGVLCDLYAKKHPEAYWDQTPSTHFDFVSTDDRTIGACRISSIRLPNPVMTWAGLEDNDGLIPGGAVGPHSTLMGANDGTFMGNCNAKTFMEIADIIEEKF